MITEYLYNLAVNLDSMIKVFPCKDQLKKKTPVHWKVSGRGEEWNNAKWHSLWTEHIAKSKLMKCICSNTLLMVSDDKLQTTNSCLTTQYFHFALHKSC